MRMMYPINLRLQLHVRDLTKYIRALHSLQNSEKSKTQKHGPKYDQIIENLKEKLIYCDYIEHTKLKFFNDRKKRVNQKEVRGNCKSYSLALKYINDCDSDIDNKLEEKNPNVDEKWKSIFTSYQLNEYQKTSDIDERFGSNSTNKPSNIPSNWMADYEQYDDSQSMRVHHRVANQNIPISKVPCGGCGAFLHCQNSELPGYLPIELFIGLSDGDLKNTICQRCHFMKYYDTVIKVQVSAEDYPKILGQIKINKKGALVLLMVDLTDFPCSIWPNIIQIIGKSTPMFVIGNKIDLLPQDCPDFIKNVEKCLLKTLEESNIPTRNIEHIALISSKTGYGIERLIHKLQRIWNDKGDVYMIGCTNVGKSSLFNALIQSDFCKIENTNLIQRATISSWPGTTLNLLKFPILKPSPSDLYMRMQRRKNDKLKEEADEMLRRQQFQITKNIRHRTLRERVNKTYTKATSSAYSFPSEDSKVTNKIGIDEKSKLYKYCRWCYDTPGVVHSDQTLHLLTTEELSLTLPKQIISPRTFIFKPGQTLFLAGLGRLDLLKGPEFIRITVFSSNTLPVTMCRTVDADDIYNKLLLTEVFVVPVNDPERLKSWPKLSSKEFSITGIDKNFSAADILLSSAGWISITPNENDCVVVRGWTPEGRGIYLRTPALLAKSVTLRGRRMTSSPTYHRGRQVYVKI